VGTDATPHGAPHGRARQVWTIAEPVEERAAIEPEQIEQAVRVADAEIRERSVQVEPGELQLDAHLGMEADPARHEARIELQGLLESEREVR